MANIKSAERTFKLLEYFEKDRSPRTLKQIADGLGWPMPSAHALLKTAVEMGYLIYDTRSRQYFPSPRLASLTTWISTEFLENSEAMTAFARLARETGDSVVLSVQSDIYVQHIAVVQGRGLQQQPAERGLQPITESCAGLMLLTLSSDTAVDRTCRRVNIAMQNPHYCDPASIVAQVARFRDMGYSKVINKPRKNIISFSMLLPVGSRGRVLSLTVGGERMNVEHRSAEILAIMRGVIN